MMDFESPDVEKDFPGLYASETAKKNQSRDSDYSDEEKVSRKDLLIGKRRERKESKKDKGYIAFEGESSEDDVDETRSPGKSKKIKGTFKFSVKDRKEKLGKAKDKETKDKKEKEEDKEKESKKEKDTKDNKKDKSKEQKKKKEKKILKIKDKKKKSSDQEKSEERPIFGVSLSDAVERNRSHDGIELPVVVRECIDYIEEHGTWNLRALYKDYSLDIFTQCYNLDILGLQEIRWTCKGLSCEGIYRISGVKSKVRNLKSQYNGGEKVYLYEHEPHIVASLLKQFLRDLPEPILTAELTSKFEEAAAMKNEQKRVETLGKLIECLPSCNRVLLSWIFVHMLHVVNLEKRNKMNLQNVSIVLSPTMQISHRVLHALFAHSDILFKGTEIKKYVPPTESDSTRLSLELPDSPTAIEEELYKQENLLNIIHAELNTGLRDKQKEEQLWEIQRVVTQLKRKLRFLRQVQGSSKPACSDEPPPPSKSKSDDFHIDTTLQQTPETTLQQTPETTFQQTPETTLQQAPETTLQQAPETILQQVPETTLQQASETTLQQASETTLQQASETTLQQASETILQQASETTLQQASETTLQQASETTLQQTSETSFQQTQVTSTPKSQETTPLKAQETPLQQLSDDKKFPSTETHSFEEKTLSETVKQCNLDETQVSISKESEQEQLENAGQSLSLKTLEILGDRKEILEETVSISETVINVQVTQQEKPEVEMQDSVARSDNIKIVEDQMSDNADSSSVEEAQQVNSEDEELLSLLHEERMLLLQQEELLLLGDELKRKINSERLEIDRLKAEIAEYQQLYKYKQYSFDSTENSSYESDSSDSDGDEEDLVSVLEDLIKENQTLERKNVELSRQIQQEREACMDIKVQMKMLQMEAKPMRA